jgi:hypothetical protein
MSADWSANWPVRVVIMLPVELDCVAQHFSGAQLLDTLGYAESIETISNLRITCARMRIPASMSLGVAQL